MATLCEIVQRAGQNWETGRIGGTTPDNGIFDEPRSQGINGQDVFLIIGYPGGTRLILHTTTESEPVDAAALNTVSAAADPGWYSFYNVLLDEDYIGDPDGSGLGIGEPTYRGMRRSCQKMHGIIDIINQ